MNLEDYPRPKDMPNMFVDEDNIFNVHYGSIVLTANHMVHSVAEHRRLNSNAKMRVMIVGNAAETDLSEMIRIGETDWVADVTIANALVLKSKFSRVLGNLFMKLNKNPFPTRIFNDEKSAREWLLSVK